MGPNHSHEPSTSIRGGVHPTVEARCGPRCVRRGLVGSCGGLHEIAHPHQVVHSRGEGEQPADSLHATEFDFAQQPDRLQPSEDLFDPFPLLLTHGVARMAGGPFINRTGTVCRVLGHMGRHLPRPQILDELVCVIVLIPTQRDPACGGPGVQQGDRRLPFRRAGRRGEARVHDQSMPILHQHMPHEAQLGLLARRLLVQPGLRIGRRGVRGIRPALAATPSPSFATNGRRPAPDVRFHVLRHSCVDRISFAWQHRSPSRPEVLHLELELKLANWP